LWGLVALIIGKLLLHYGMDRLIRSRHTGWRTVTDVVGQFHLESLALGGVGACLVFFHHQRVLRWVYHPITQIVFGAWFVGIVCWWSPFPRMPYAVHAAVYLVVIMNVACNPNRLLSLENRFLDFGGKLSYGIYMTHPIFMFASFALVRNLRDLGTGHRPGA
jgi:peptidoglycan/LPS O-acetylase OafA/YrhL